MKKYEVLALHKELLQRLKGMGVQTEDYIKVDIYRDYLLMKQKNEKVLYIVNTLSKRYSMGVRTIYRVIKEMQEECQFLTL